MSVRKFLVLLLSAALLTGCWQPVRPIANLPGEFTAHAAGLDSYNSFAFKLYQELLAEENILFSPVSVALALSMAYNGAAGETQAAMAQALGVADIDREQLNEANRLLLALLQESDVRVEVANSLWLRQGLPFLADFVELIQTYYHAQVSQLDFKDAGAVPTINEWVADKTQGLIDKIVEEPIDPLTIAFLLNAVYFRGDWTDAFAAADTRDDVFHTPAGPVTVPFMHKTASFDYLENDDLQAIRLPYAQGRTAMYIFLPADPGAFNEKLNQEQWARWQGSFKSAWGSLALPKFKFEFEESLNEALAALGMGIVFEPMGADFSKMIEIPGQNVYISQVKHKAFIEVDEKGTEAAAVTSLEVRMTGLPPQPSFAMKIDRPFFFLIYDQETDAILFMGSVCDPS